MSKQQKSDNTEVLSYKIDTTDFDRGMNKVIAALEKLERREYLTKLQSSVDGISTGVNSISFNNMEQGLASVEERFSTMGVVGMSVLNNLTNGIMSLVQRFVFDKLLGDAINGFEELNLQINSTQTILANTSGRFGTTLDQVNQGLDALNDYADKTIYNFSNMTQAVGAFTSAGVDLGNSIQAIKGVANMAAYAGASAESASSGMYQFSNALSMGYMMLYQWNSLVYSGLGTKQLEQELISSARGLGVNIDAILKEYGGMFRYSLEAGWADSKVIMHTLAKFSGDVTEEELRKMKYTEEEIKRILALGKTAEASATKVISYQKLISSLSESVGSGWAKTFRLLVGDFEQGKALFTMISDNLLKVIERGAENRNKLVADWAKFGGRDVVVESIDKLLKTYNQLLIVVGQSLNQIFPPITGKQVADATKQLGKLIDMLIPTQKGFDNIGRIVRGFAATIDIPIQFFKALAKYLYLIIRPMLNFKFTWIDTIVGLADFMTKLRNEIVKGDLFFKKISSWGDIFKLLLEKIRNFIEDVKRIKAVQKMREVFDAITMRFGIKDPKFLGRFLSDAQKSFTSFFNSFDKANALAVINKIIEAIIGFGKRVYRFLKPVILYVVELVKNFAKALGLAMKDLSTNFSWNKLKDVFGILTKFLALKTVTSIIEKFGFASEIFMTLGMGFAKTIGYIGVALQQFASSNDADTLLSVALAIGILSASVFMLATLPEKDIQKGIAAVTTIYAGLAGSLMALNKVLAGNEDLMNMAGGSLKLALLPPVLIALALAVAIMADTLIKLGGVPLKQIVKGFGALLAILGALSLFMVVNSKTGGFALSTGLGFLALAASLMVLAKAISMFTEIKPETIGKAALAVGGLLLMVGLLSKAKAIGPQMLLLGVAITGIAASLVVLGLAFKFLGTIDFVTIATGLTNLLVMLGAVYFASFVGSKIQIAAIAKMALVAIAIAGVGLAFSLIAKIDPGSVILSSTAIALSIGILYGVVSLIKPTILPGVAGLIALSIAIGAFAVALSMFDKVNFKAVALGGVALGVLVLAIIAIGSVITPILPAVAAFAGVLLLAAGAMALFGAGVYLVGAGVKKVAEALVLLSKAGNVMFDTLTNSLPKFGSFLLQLVTVIAIAATQAIPAITTIAITIIIALCTALITATPYIASALITVFSSIIDILGTLGPKLNNFLFRMLYNVLVNLEKNVGHFITMWNRIQTKFLNGLADTMGPLVGALMNYVISLIRALADAIDNDGPRLRKELQHLALSLFVFFVESMVDSAKVLDAGNKWFVNYMIYGAGKQLLDKLPAIKNIGLYFIKGLISGLTSQTAAALLLAAAAWIADQLIGGTNSELDINSPSGEGEKIGDYYIQGIGKGLNPEKLKSKLSLMKDAMISFMDGALNSELNFQPTISPVLDLGAMTAIEQTIARSFGAQRLNLATAPGFSLRSNPLNQSTQGSVIEHTEYKQYITAPSPLSVEEVARRTASLIGQKRR